MLRLLGIALAWHLLQTGGPLVAQVARMPPAAAGTRTWTTSEGQSFQASLINVQGEQLTLRLANGQAATFPVARLSPADQLFIKNALAATPAPITNTNTRAHTHAVAKGLPAEKRTWPAKVEVDSRAIEVKLVPEKTTANLQVYRSQFFEFTSQEKIAGSVMKEIARTFEATHSLVQSLPWGVNPQPPYDLGHYQAKFYTTMEGYHADGGPRNSGGVYFSKDRIFRVPFPSLGLELRGKTYFKNDNYRNDTIVHEITHQMMHDWLPFIPTWVAEGTAEYCEMIPYHAGRFLTGSHERGIKEYIKEAGERGVKPADIGQVLDHLSMTGKAWHERADGGGREQHRLYFASCLMIYFFSHLDGDGKGTRLFQYFDKMTDAREAWDKFFNHPEVKRTDDGGFRYPSSVALPSQKQDGSYGLDQLNVLLDGRDAATMQKAVVDGFKKIGVRW